MTSRDFCYWLQGYFEILGQSQPLTADQVNIVKQHLAMVFKHEIDPSMGDKAHQQSLSEIHGDISNKPFCPATTLIRC